jgi:hypothetical protein
MYVMIHTKSCAWHSHNPSLAAYASRIAYLGASCAGKKRFAKRGRICVSLLRGLGRLSLLWAVEHGGFVDDVDEEA